MMMMIMIMMIMMKGFWGMVDQQDYFNPLFVKKIEINKSFIIYDYSLIAE